MPAQSSRQEWLAGGRHFARETAREQSRRYFLFVDDQFRTTACRTGSVVASLATQRTSLRTSRARTIVAALADSSRNGRTAFRQPWYGDGQRATAVEKKHTNGRARRYVRRRLRRARRHAADDGRGRRTAAARRQRRSSHAAMDRRVSRSRGPLRLSRAEQDNVRG